MPRTAPEDLELHYKKLDARYCVTHRPSYSELVTPNGNNQAPVHRWFHFKEAFSCRLLPAVLADLSYRDARINVLDPFAGSCTTGVALGQLTEHGQFATASFTGYETNPFLHLLASAKLGILTDPPAADEVRRFTDEVLRVALTCDPAQRPELSTFQRDAYFNPDRLEALLRLKSSLTHLSADVTVEVARLASVALAASVEASSQLRRDGRTLRYAPEKRPVEPLDHFRRLSQIICDDVPARHNNLDGSVARADIRSIDRAHESPFDLVLFSPPYPNNIDYTEVYKLEAWMLGLIDSKESFRAQRRQTVRSHGSLDWGDHYSYKNGSEGREIEQLIAPICDSVPTGRYERSRRQVVEGYVDDMYLVIRAAYDALKPGGALVFAVGNSVHDKDDNSYVIASDLLLARVAELVGFDIVALNVARYPRRRRTSSAFMRESIVYARKPA